MYPRLQSPSWQGSLPGTKIKSKYKSLFFPHFLNPFLSPGSQDSVCVMEALRGVQGQGSLLSWH